MTDSERVVLLKRALQMAGKFLRQNPAGDLSLYPQDMIYKALMGGQDDPEGERYVSYFLTKAIEEQIENKLNGK